MTADGAPLAVTGARSASRIPLPTGELGARSATHLAALMSGPGPPESPSTPLSSARGHAQAGTTPGGLAVVAEGGSSVASPADASPDRRASDDGLLDQCNAVDIRDSGDCAGMGAPAEEGPPGLRAQGDGSRTSVPTPPADTPAAAEHTLHHPGSANSPPLPAVPEQGPASPHALLVEAVCSRSQLAAAHSGERLSNLAAAQKHLPGADTPASGARIPSQSVIAAQTSRNNNFEANASDLFLSTSASLDLGQLADDIRATAPVPAPIPEVTLTAATPLLGTPPESEHVAEPAPPPLETEPVAEPARSPPPEPTATPAPIPDPVDAFERAAAPPPPPPTPAQESPEATPTRKNSPVTSTTASKKAPKVAPASKTASKAAPAVVVAKPSSARRLSASRLSSSRLGGSTGNVGSIAGNPGAKDGAKDGATSVTLIKAPPRGQQRPASARSVRSATTTGTVTAIDAHATPTPHAATPKRTSTATATAPGKGATATKSISATVNRKVSVATVRGAAQRAPSAGAGAQKEVVVPKLDLTSARNKPAVDLGSARGKPASDGGSPAHPATKANAASAKAEPVKKTATVPRPSRVFTDAPLSSGAGEDVAVLKGSCTTTEGWASCLSRVDEELKGTATPLIVLVAELASRHGVLLDALKDKDVATHAAEAQFAATLAHRQAVALQTVARQSDLVRGLVADTWAESSSMRELLEAENIQLVHKLADCTRDLERERASNTKAKTTKVAVDSSMKQMRTKIKELETRLEAKAAEDDAKLREQVTLVHSLKEKLRARSAVVDQRTKELDAAHARVAELQSLETAKVHLDTRLGSVTQMLQMETKSREKAEVKLKATAAKLSQMQMSREDAELDLLRAERDQLKAELEELTKRSSSDLSQLRDELKTVMEKLKARSSQLAEKDAELRHYLTLRPGEPSRKDLDELKETFAQLAAHNEQMEQELNHCRQELAQRKALAEQDNVLHVRDNLLSVLHSRDAAAQGHHGPHWPREELDGRKLIETYATLERKSVRIKAYEQQIQQLERQQESSQNLRLRMETRIAQLEHLVAEFTKQALGVSKRATPPRCNVAW